MHAKSFGSYLMILRKLLLRCRQYNIKFNLEKTIFSDTKAHWCGMDINGKGICLNARKAHSFESMKAPTLAGELGEFIMAINWMAVGKSNMTIYG